MLLWSRFWTKRISKCYQRPVVYTGINGCSIVRQRYQNVLDLSPAYVGQMCPLLSHPPERTILGSFRASRAVKLRVSFQINSFSTYRRSIGHCNREYVPASPAASGLDNKLAVTAKSKMHRVQRHLGRSRSLDSLSSICQCF